MDSRQCGDFELAATLYREHLKKHGSQTQEEKLIEMQYKDEEDDRRDKRQKANAAKEEAVEAAREVDLETDTAVILKFRKAQCRAELQAWALWLTDRGIKIGSKAGQVDCLLIGNLQPLREKSWCH